MSRIKTHPGRVLRAELEARGMSANRLALAIRVPANRITAILHGQRAVTAETAVRLGRFLGTGPAFWMNLQSAYDVSREMIEEGRKIKAISPPSMDEFDTLIGEARKRTREASLKPSEVKAIIDDVRSRK